MNRVKKQLPTWNTTLSPKRRIDGRIDYRETNLSFRKHSVRSLKLYPGSLHIFSKTLDLELTPGDTLLFEVNYENRRSQ